MIEGSRSLVSITIIIIIIITVFMYIISSQIHSVSFHLISVTISMFSLVFKVLAWTHPQIQKCLGNLTHTTTSAVPHHCNYNYKYPTLETTDWD